MGTRPDFRTARHWYPQGHPPPSSTLPTVIATFAGVLGAVVIVLLLLGALTDRPVRDLLPAVIGPTLGAAVGFLVRRRTLNSRAAEGLYFLQVRPVDQAGRRPGRWRSHWTLSMPGVIICRPRSSGEDLESTVRHVHEPTPVPFHRVLLTADGPSCVMRVETTAGDLEFRGRPEYLHRLALGAAPDAPRGA